MNFQEEKELFEKLICDKSKIVFWKRDMPVQKNDVITTEKIWTTDTAYLVENKLYDIGTGKLLCETWIDENYLEEVSKGKNIVVLEE